eukprot:403343887
MNALLDNSQSSMKKGHGRNNKSQTRSQRDVNFYNNNNSSPTNPNKSLQLQQNTATQPTIKANHANGKFTCECTICLEQTKPEYHLDIYQNQLDVREHLFQGMNRDFHWLMQHLLPINEKIRGCELLFPDSVLFQRGKPKIILKNDKEFCLMPIRQLSKFNLQSIYKDFSNVVRERKKDFAGPFHKMYGLSTGLTALLNKNEVISGLFNNKRQEDGASSITLNGMAGLSKQPNSQNHENSNQFNNKFASAKDFSPEHLQRDKMRQQSNPQFTLENTNNKQSISGGNNNAISTAPPLGISTVLTDKNIYYKDVALIRYRPDEKGESLVQVVNETGFMSTFHKRANDDYWKTVSCIQTNIKSKLGCGQPIIIKYYAPLDYDEPESEIVYDYKSLGADEDLILKDQHQYCLKQCYKMCYYIQKVYGLEVLKMRTEFSKDENGTIWFMYASSIVARPVKGRGQQFQTKKVNYVNQENKTNLLNELERHQDQARENNSQNIKKMYDIMGQHYENIKDHLGLKEAFENSDEDEQTEEIFKKLRPQSPYKFKELVRNQFDPKKFNRMMGKADKKLDHEQVKDIILYNKPVIQQPKRRYDKPDYAQLNENMRLVHNYVPGSDSQHSQPIVANHGLRQSYNNQNSTSNIHDKSHAFKSQRLLSFRQRPMTAPTYKSVGRPQTGNPMTASTNTNTQNNQGQNNTSGVSLSNNRQKAFFAISRGQYQFESHKNIQPPSSSNISSMRELQKMYEPPIPRHQIPLNNPFYNHQIASRVSNKQKNFTSASSLRQSHNTKHGKSSPRSLLNWINSPNTKKIQQKMANRIGYLKFLSQNKNAYISDLALVNQSGEGDINNSQNDVNGKMNQLLMLAEDPKTYMRAMEDLQREEENNAYGYRAKQDHLFDDKYIISDKTIINQQMQQRQQHNAQEQMMNINLNDYQ